MVSSYDLCSFIFVSVLQVDSDLIFDSIEETNNVYSHERRQRDLSNSVEESQSSHGEEEENQHWFSGALHRIKRHLGNLFHPEDSEQKKHKRRTRQDDERAAFAFGQDDYDQQQENVGVILTLKN